jgi:hypothetical protein
MQYADRAVDLIREAILSQKCHTNMRVILNGYRDMGI